MAPVTVTYNGSLPEFAMYITLYSLYSLWSKYILYLSVLAVSVFLPFCPSVRPVTPTWSLSVAPTSRTRAPRGKFSVTSFSYRLSENWGGYSLRRIPNTTLVVTFCCGLALSYAATFTWNKPQPHRNSCYILIVLHSCNITELSFKIQSKLCEPKPMWAATGTYLHMGNKSQ